MRMSDAPIAAMATHDKDIVNRMKKRVIVVEKGLIAKDSEKGKYKSEGI